MAKVRSWLVGVQQRIRLPHRESDDTIERTFTVRATTAKQAEKAVRDTGIKGEIQSAIPEKHPYMLAETLSDARSRSTGNEPRRKPSRKSLKDMTRAELKKLRVILHILPDGTMEIKEKGADSLERQVASWNPPNRPDMTERSWVGGYISGEKVADNAKMWLDMVAKKYDLDTDEIIADSWRGGGMKHKASPYDYTTNTFTGKVKAKVKERPNLNNVVGLHSSNKSWRNFLKDAELREEKKGIKHYISSNGHYIVLPDGEVITFYGYHGQVAFDKIVADRAGWLKERDKSEKELAELLHPKPAPSSLQAIHDARSPRSKSADESQSNALTVDPDDPRVERWMKDQGRMDVRGIDTPKGKSKPQKRKAKHQRVEPGMKGMRK